MAEKIAYELGILPKEFWGMTPREFIVIAKSRMDRTNLIEENNNYRLAVMMAHTANLFSSDKKVYTAEDFISKKEENKMDFNFMAEILKAYTIALDGVVEG